MASYIFHSLEVYYGTPYDRHVILEESSDVRYRKRTSRSLEDGPGLGSRILRRLSSNNATLLIRSISVAVRVAICQRIWLLVMYIRILLRIVAVLKIKPSRRCA
ncbi:hypothetical protein EVAR_72593_1 [Eumeta japonica]|uniref:Uncharacterized protein n=1 Tax=Eumeta variegata TaxID=151549 RepID=A0A4C1TD78_EUMVA|nr:hypothetical protein EVAR_72593_1 [Eumeta japonica]